MSSAVWQQILGGGLATFGGYIAVIIRIRVERKVEVRHIKISLTDELSEVCAIISKLTETHTTTKVISNIYFEDLEKTTESFNFHKQKLFLISKKEIRKEIFNFYKKLDKNIKESANTVQQLGETENTNSNGIISTFKEISNDSEKLIEQIDKYKFKVFWIF